MPSRTDSRAVVEIVARLVAVGVLLLLAWRAGAPLQRASANQDGIASALSRATRGMSREGIHLRGDSLPGATERAWLRSVRAAGTPVTWSRGDRVAPIVAAEVLAGPDARTRVSALGVTPGASLHDAAGWLADPRDSTAIVQEVDVEPAGAIEWRSAAGVARLTPARPGDVPAVLVLARAGWEGKFVAQALQDAGWRVETDFLVNSSAAGTPARVRSRGPGSLDPGRLAVVVALDESAATRASALATYVRQGGGLLLAPDAALAPALRNISAAVPAVLQEASLGALRSGEPRRGLDRHALRLTADVAVPLEREAGAVRVAARRLDLGRVAVVGYRDTWRWRMEGADGAPEAHAAWWSSLVAAVASPPPVGAVDARDDPAPLPSMYDALGAPLTTAAAARFTSPVTVDALLLSLTCLALLLAWTARRARGLP